MEASMKKILWLLILFMPFIYGMEDRKRKNPEASSEEQTQDLKQFIDKKQKNSDDIIQASREILPTSEEQEYSKICYWDLLPTEIKEYILSFLIDSPECRSLFFVSTEMRDIATSLSDREEKALREPHHVNADILVLALRNNKYLLAQKKLNKYTMLSFIWELLDTIKSSETDSIERTRKLLCLFRGSNYRYIIDNSFEFYNQTMLTKIIHLINSIKDPSLKEEVANFFKNKISRWLTIAVQNNNIQETKELLEAGGDPDGTVYSGSSMFSHAIMKAHNEIAKMLIQYGIDASNPHTLDFAKKYRNQEMVDFLQSLFDERRKQEEKKLMDFHSPFINAFKRCDFDFVKSLITKNNANILDEKGLSGLIYGVFFDSYGMVMLFLSNNADINLADPNGWSPLFWAVIRNNINMVKLLVSEGASINLKDNVGGTPLTYSVRCGHKQISEFLLQNGAS